MGFSDRVSGEVRALVSAHAFDAHLDYPGQGGWGSAEQLEDAHRLRGALRVFFCEVNGKAPASVKEHLGEIARLDPLLRANAPGRSDPRHIEGCESLRTAHDFGSMLWGTKFEYGVRSVGPIYHANNPLGGCSKEPGLGLTPFGRDAITWAYIHTGHVDLAHMSHASMRETLELIPVGGKLSYTHGGVWHEGVTHPLIANGNVERCISRELAEKLLRYGGFVGLSPCAPFYDNPDDGDFFRHIIELGRTCDFQRVGIGTDYGGILDEWRWPGCETVFDVFCFVAHELLESGMSKQCVTGIIGDNFRRHLGLL